MTSASRLMERAVPPSPAGALEVAVRCGPSRTYFEQGLHPATISADWSLQTHHDLPAERIAMSLGGYCTCVETDRIVLPVVADWLHYQLRARPLPVGCADGWRSGGQRGGWRSASACALADRARSLPDLGDRHGVNFLHVSDIVRQVARAHALPDDVADEPGAVRLAASAVREPRHLGLLWRWGIPARTVRDIFLLVSPPGRTPLPSDFYFFAVYRDVDLEWVGATLRQAPAASLGDTGAAAVRLAATMTAADRAEPGLRGQWLALAVGIDDAATLSDRGYRPREVALLAEDLRTSVGQAAAVLTTWLTLGYRPTPAFVAGFADATGSPLLRASLSSHVASAIDGAEPASIVTEALFP